MRVLSGFRCAMSWLAVIRVLSSSLFAMLCAGLFIEWETMSESC